MVTPGIDGDVQCTLYMEVKLYSLV